VLLVLSLCSRKRPPLLRFLVSYEGILLVHCKDTFFYQSKSLHTRYPEFVTNFPLKCFLTTIRTIFLEFFRQSSKQTAKFFFLSGRGAFASSPFVKYLFGTFSRLIDPGHNLSNSYQKPLRACLRYIVRPIRGRKQCFFTAADIPPAVPRLTSCRPHCCDHC